MEDSREVFVEDAMPRDRLALLLDHFSRIEPPRVCRRLQLMSSMEHHEHNDEQIFP